MKHMQQVYVIVSLVAVLAAAVSSDALALSDMISNYAKVSVNNGTGRDRSSTTTTTTTTRTTTTTEVLPLNDTDYDDFDDLSETTESSRQGVDTQTMLKYFNGLVSLLTLMYKFSGRPGPGPGASPRYQPDAVSQRFKAQSEESSSSSYQPISNFPPYDPLKANAAESYAQNDMKTSYDADLEEYKSEYASQNVAASNSDAYDAPYESKQSAWNYKPWMVKAVHDANWKQTANDDAWSSNVEAYPVYRPEKKPIEYQDYGAAEDDEDHPHHHHHHAVVDEDRESKRPYSYYFLGRKLWYIPLIFSVYFILYIAALVLKSVARHKIQFPEKVWDLHDHVGYGKHRRSRRLDDATESYATAIENSKNKFM